MSQDPFGLRDPRRRAAGHAEQVAFVRADTANVVIVDRVDDIAQADTDYCIHGKTTCSRCGEWCWLGDQTAKLVMSGQAAPLCAHCAVDLVPADVVRTTNAGDHRRADGPH